MLWHLAFSHSYDLATISVTLLRLPWLLSWVFRRPGDVLWPGSHPQRSRVGSPWGVECPWKETHVLDVKERDNLVISSNTFKGLSLFICLGLCFRMTTNTTHTLHLLQQSNANFQTRKTPDLHQMFMILDVSSSVPWRYGCFSIVFPLLVSPFQHDYDFLLQFIDPSG